jgi:hypothetical protein
LKTLDPDKEIKVNSFDFLWLGFAKFGWIWPDLASAWILFYNREK